jgi:hypothetical protein
VQADTFASVTKRDLPGGGFDWDRVKDGSIAPMVATTLAHWSLVEHAGANVLRLPAQLSCDVTTDDDDFDSHLGLRHEIDVMTPEFKLRWQSALSGNEQRWVTRGDGGALG